MGVKRVANKAKRKDADAAAPTAVATDATAAMVSGLSLILRNPIRLLIIRSVCLKSDPFAYNNPTRLLIIRSVCL
jgi:hypothetical protein